MNHNVDRARELQDAAAIDDYWGDGVSEPWDDYKGQEDLPRDAYQQALYDLGRRCRVADLAESDQGPLLETWLTHADIDAVAECVADAIASMPHSDQRELLTNIALGHPVGNALRVWLWPMAAADIQADINDL